MKTEEYFNEGTPFKSMNQGEISKAMGVNTKPAHKLEVGGYWVMIDSKMPNEDFEFVKEAVTSAYNLARKILRK